MTLLDSAGQVERSTSGRRAWKCDRDALGGNQQKVIVARDSTAAQAPRTRSADRAGRGSIEFIHRQIIAKRDAGTAVLLVSAELDEVLEISDGSCHVRAGCRRLDGRAADKSEWGCTWHRECEAVPPREARS